MIGLDVLPLSDPTRILRYRDGIYAVDLLAAAIVEFRLFDYLADNPGTLASVVEHYGWDERPADVLLTLCKANGFAKEDAEGILAVTDTAREHLCQASPWNLSAYFASLRDRPVVADFVRVLQTGRPAHWSGLDEAGGDWHDAMLDPDFARTFTAAMDCRGVFLGKKLADAVAEWTVGENRLLDVGGGSGVYACALAANAPQLEAVVLEQEPVAGVARECIAERELADRVRVEVGDMFEDPWPEACDLHLFSNVMHDWDKPAIAALLERSRDSLVCGGHVLVHEAFLNKAKNGPLPVAEYSCILAHSTRGRCYSTAEMAELIRAAGFDVIAHRDTAADRGVIVGALNH
ncbi:MAG: methyltransferase [Verrucomicrobiales bacterium]